MKVNEPFIKMYNVFAENNSKYHLNQEELYLYGLLKIYSNIEDKTVTTINMIHDLSPVNFLAVEKKSKERIKQTLFTLNNKGVVRFQNDDLKVNTTIIIEFVENLKDDLVGKGIKGHEQITFEQFNSFGSMMDFYIHFTVKRFEKLDGFKCSYERWADILGTSTRQSKSKIDDAVQRKIIYKNIGDYTENEIDTRKQLKQDSNTYRVREFNDEEKSIATSKVEGEQKKQDNKENSNFVAEIENKTEYEKSLLEYMENFKDRGIFPDFDEYYFYEEVKWNINQRDGIKIGLEEKFIQAANKRINGFKSNVQSKGIYEEKHHEAILAFNKDNTGKLVKNANHAIKVKGEVVIVNEGNIDNYKWQDVDSILHGENNWTKMSSFQTMEMGTSKYNDQPYMIESAWEIYKQCVKEDKKITFEMLNEIKSKVINDNMDKIQAEDSQLNDEYISYDVDLLNYSIELSEKKKKDIYDISEIF